MKAKIPRIERWVLTPHAASRAEERHISIAELTSILIFPDLVIPQGPKWIFAKTIASRKDNLVAAVLLEKEDRNLWVVITLMVHFVPDREKLPSRKSSSTKS